MCHVCRHPQKPEIEADLTAAQEPDWRGLRRKYGVHHLALMAHKRDHIKPAASAEINISRVSKTETLPITRGGVLIPLRAQTPMVTRPLTRVYDAWQDADAQERARIVAFINDQITPPDVDVMEFP